MRIYFGIFLSFFKIGAFTIGGGYAMIPLIEQEVIDKKKWIAREEFTEMLALAQSAPGPIAINTAVFVGYKLKRKKGALVAALGAIVPSFVIILLIALFFSNAISHNETIERIFKGIRPVVVALIAVPAFNMLVKVGLKYKPLTVAVAAALLICLLNVSPVIVITAAGILGVLNGLYTEKRARQ